MSVCINFKESIFIAGCAVTSMFLRWKPESGMNWPLDDLWVLGGQYRFSLGMSFSEGLDSYKMFLRVQIIELEQVRREAKQDGKTWSPPLRHCLLKIINLSVLRSSQILETLAELRRTSRRVSEKRHLLYCLASFNLRSISDCYPVVGSATCRIALLRTVQNHLLGCACPEKGKEICLRNL